MKLRSFAVALTLSLPSLLFAAPTPEQRKEARAHYEKAVTHFNLGEYHDAAEEFRQVYRVAPQPVILYDAAQAYRLANENTDALTLYESFLRQSPNAPVRNEVQSRILELRAKVKQAPDAKSPDSKAPDAKSPDSKAPDAKSPDSKAPDTKSPDTKVATPTTKTPAPKPPIQKPGLTAAPDASGGSERLKPVAELIKANRKGFRECFDKWSAAHPGVAGKVKLSFYLDPDGNMDQADAEETGFDAPEVADCIVTFAGTLAYPKSGGGKFTRFAYPFDFKPH